MKKIIAIIVPILAVLLSACGSEMPIIPSSPRCPPKTRNYVRAFIAPRSIEVESIDMKQGHILLRLPEDTARSVFPGASVSEEKNKLYKALSEGNRESTRLGSRQRNLLLSHLSGARHSLFQSGTNDNEWHDRRYIIANRHSIPQFPTCAEITLQNGAGTRTKKTCYAYGRGYEMAAGRG